MPRSGSPSLLNPVGWPQGRCAIYPEVYTAISVAGYTRDVRNQKEGGKMSGLKKFLLRGNVVDLAVAVVIGAAFGTVVQALVKDLITPIIAAFGGVPDFSAWYFTVNGSVFLIGDFINALLAFLIIAAVVYYFVVLPVQGLMDRHKGEPPVAPVATRDCPYCLSKVPLAASRCAYCTSELPASIPEASIGTPVQPAS